MTGLVIDLASLGATAARLGTATALGALIGLNRRVRHHPAGLRTHALVALGAATATAIGFSLGASPADQAAAASRIIQGILTGIGFVGAGVVLHRNDPVGVHGLTTAASIWLVAILGIACGAGLVTPALVAFALVFLVLMVGGPIERFFEERHTRRRDPERRPTGPGS
jgi:putative Mg2+ transporter-C (MgtC) family protein